MGLPHGENIPGDIGAIPQWSSIVVPEQFWYWNGSDTLILKSPQFDANGNVTEVINNYLLPPRMEGYLQFTTDDKTKGIIFNNAGVLYSSDYTLCAQLDDTDKMVWKQCLGTPATFSVVAPENCSTGGCSSGEPCCPPYVTCQSNGTCSPCFGDSLKFQASNCPNASYMVQCQDNGAFKCVSRCDGTAQPQCGDNQTTQCEATGASGEYSWQCAWKCTGEVPQCGGTDLAMCTGADAQGWKWECPENPCDHPPPPFDPSKAKPSGSGKWVWHSEGPTGGGGYYQNVNSPGSPWMYPQYQCNTNTWTFLPGCDQSYKSNCDPSQKAVCSADTSYMWQCVDPSKYTNLCGVSTGGSDCGADAQCFDISRCGTGSNSANDWRWICPSSQGTTECEIIKIYDWNYPPVSAQNYEKGIVYKGDVPVYPTILNNQCRGAGSELNHPNARSLINNPPGLVLGSGTNDDPFVYLGTPDVTGKDSYLLTKHTVGDSGVSSWDCATKNPCYPHGSFVNNDGSVYTTPLEIQANPGVVSPPTSNDLLVHGKCSCQPGFAGNSCQYSNSICNHGTIQSCNISGGKCLPEQYSCMCAPDYYGDHCQFTMADCSNHGVPDDASDSLQCTCQFNYSGTVCDKCIKVPPSVIDVKEGGEITLGINGSDAVIMPSPGISQLRYMNYCVPVGSTSNAALDMTIVNVSPDGSFNLRLGPNYLEEYPYMIVNPDGSFGPTQMRLGADALSPSPNLFKIDSCGWLVDSTDQYVYVWNDSQDCREADHCCDVVKTVKSDLSSFQAVVYLKPIPDKPSSC